MASNPDIALAATEPAVDFDGGTLLTHMWSRPCGRPASPTILYASGSGVYGDLGDLEATRIGPLVPVSTYGASKLAGEALIASYCAMFGFTGLAFRFGNVVGARQTHGVGFDFIRRPLVDPSELRILGDGRQSKSYIAVRSGRRGPAGGRKVARNVRCLQRGDGRLHQRQGDRRTRHRSGGLQPHARLSFAGGAGGGRETSRRPPRHSTHP